MSSAIRSVPNVWRTKSPEDIRVDVVIPVLNEAHVLEKSIRTLESFFRKTCELNWRLVIAENGSTDGTADVGARLATEFSRVECLKIGRRGRGRALRVAWSRPEADILCYTDVDLSTELEAFPRLFHALIHESYDLAIGSRLAKASRTTRSLKRELISRAYNQILRWSLNVGFSDAQTGFKAITREVADDVLPLIKDESWFLDTELLVLSEHLGYRVADIPVRWIEDDDSRVKIVSTAWEDLKGVARLRRDLRSNAWIAAAPRRRVDAVAASHVAELGAAGRPVPLKARLTPEGSLTSSFTGTRASR
jgi:glycosyltransferase involved in cell wall biosynthesis